MKINQDLIELKKIKEFVELNEKKVLEIGCGDGRITNFLKDDVKEIIAIDSELDQIEKAKKEIAGVDFQVGLAENLNFGESVFDIVLFTLSLHHCNDIKKALQETKRVLSREGKLIIIEPVHDGELQAFFSLDCDEKKELSHAKQEIKDSSFNILREEVFYTKWSFDSVDELITFFLNEGYNGDKGFEPKLINLLGDRINDKPIVLKDKLIIYLLEKI